LSAVLPAGMAGTGTGCGSAVAGLWSARRDGDGVAALGVDIGDLRES